MHHRIKKLAGALAAAALAAGLTVAGTGTAHADVTPPTLPSWAEIYAPEINSSGNIMCVDNFRSNAQLQNLQLWHCHGYASDGAPQRWQFQWVGQHLGGVFGPSPSLYQIANVGSGLCIGLDPNRTSPSTILGSNLVQEPCVSALTDWMLIPATNSPDPNNQFTLVNEYDGFRHSYAMEANTFLDQNGNRLIAENWNIYNSAQWFALG